MASPITLYVLKSQNYNKSYVGITRDLDVRISQHNGGLSAYTNKYKPWIILYTEQYTDKISAHNRELYLKSTSGRRWLRRNVFNK